MASGVLLAQPVNGDLRLRWMVLRRIGSGVWFPIGDTVRTRALARQECRRHRDRAARDSTLQLAHRVARVYELVIPLDLEPHVLMGVPAHRMDACRKLVRMEPYRP